MNVKKSSQPVFHLGYRPAINGLRGFAVLWVMAFHFNLPLGRDGIFGVDMFFAISGFLISILLIEEYEKNKKIRLLDFYIRRILRLYPALLCMLIAVVFFVPRAYIISTLFYFTNWIKALHLQPESLYLDHTWSLSIEEQFYLIWPVLLMILLRSKLPRKVLFVFPASLGLISAFSRVCIWNSTQDWFRVYMGTDLHADGLLLGSALGLQTAYTDPSYFNKHKMVNTLITVLSFTLLAWLLIEKQMDRSFIPIAGNLLVSLITLVILYRLVLAPSQLIIKILSFPLLVKIGVISYGLYLWHSPISAWIDLGKSSINPIFLGYIKILLTCFIATISYVFVEKPFLKLKNRYSPNKSECTVESSESNSPKQSILEVQDSLK